MGGRRQVEFLSHDIGRFVGAYRPSKCNHWGRLGREWIVRLTVW